MNLSVKWSSFIQIFFMSWVTLFILFHIGQPLRTDDLFWHIKVGEFISQKGLLNLPVVDPFLFTATEEVKPFYHEWLFQIIVYHCHKLFSLHGLRVFHIFLILLLISHLWVYLKKYSLRSHQSAFVIFLFIVLSLQRLIQLRPHLISIVCFFGLLHLIHKHETRINLSTFFFIAIYGWVSANAHSFLPIIILFASAGIASEAASCFILKTNMAFLRVSVLKILTLTVCGLFNPKGFYLYLFYWIGQGRNDYGLIIDEWGHFDVSQGLQDYLPLSNPFIIFFIILILTGTVIVAIKRVGEIKIRPISIEDSRLIVYSCLSCLIFIYAIRFSWLLVFPVLLILRYIQTHKTISQLFVFLSFGIFVLHWIHPQTRMYFIPDIPKQILDPDSAYYQTSYDEHKYPKKAALLLKSLNIKPGRLYHPYYLGGYCEFMLWPDYQMFLDGRFEHYSRQVYFDHGEILSVTERFIDLLDSYSIDCFLIPKDFEHRRLILALQLIDWVRIWDGDFAIFIAPKHFNHSTQQVLAHYYKISGELTIPVLNNRLIKHPEISSFTESDKMRQEFMIMVENGWLKEALRGYMLLMRDQGLNDSFFAPFLHMMADVNQLAAQLGEAAEENYQQLKKILETGSE